MTFFFLGKLPGGEYHLISRDGGTNQIVRKGLFTCVVYTNTWYHSCHQFMSSSLIPLPTTVHLLQHLQEFHASGCKIISMYSAYGMCKPGWDLYYAQYVIGLPQELTPGPTKGDCKMEHSWQFPQGWGNLWNKVSGLDLFEHKIFPWGKEAIPSPCPGVDPWGKLHVHYSK